MESRLVTLKKKTENHQFGKISEHQILRSNIAKKCMLDSNKQTTSLSWYYKGQKDHTRYPRQAETKIVLSDFKAVISLANRSEHGLSICRLVYCGC